MTNFYKGGRGLRLPLPPERGEPTSRRQIFSTRSRGEKSFARICRAHTHLKANNDYGFLLFLASMSSQARFALRVILMRFSRRLFWLTAKKNKSIPFTMGMICFMLFYLSDAWAQSPDNREAAEGQNELKPLQIGQMVPDNFWTMQHMWFVDGDTVFANIEEHKGKHLILASWSLDCGPCVRSLPKLEKLQNRFEDAVQIILVNSQTRRNEYQRFYEFFNNGHRLLPDKPDMPSIVYGAYFQTLFPIRVLPHYIWIKPSGLVKAILSSEFINEQQIQAVLDRGGTK